MGKRADARSVLAEQLSRLKGVHLTRFCPRRRCFLVGEKGRSVAGLTPRIATTLCRVSKHRRRTCIHCSTIVTSKPTSLASNALPVSTLRPNVYAASHLPAGTCSHSASPMEHGRTIDRQLTKYANVGARQFVEQDNNIDPCVRQLLHYIERVKQWRIVACQLPLHSTSMRYATAIDIVCTDYATSSEVHVIEVKSTCSHVHAYEPAYIHSNTVVRRGATTGMPRSRYAQHQLQLWAMTDVLEHECGLTVTSASVVRTCPRCVVVYPLHSFFSERAQRLRPLFARAASAGGGGVKQRR